MKLKTVTNGHVGTRVCRRGLHSPQPRRARSLRGSNAIARRRRVTPPPRN